MCILHIICTLFITGLVAAVGTGCVTITPGGKYKEAAETVQERSETELLTVQQNSTAQTVPTEGSLSESQATIIENMVDGRQQDLPTQYRITYEIENGDGTVSLVTMARDEAGDLYYQDEDQELWFMPQRGGYVQAEPDQDGTLTVVSENRILKENKVHQATELFWNCAETYDKLIAPDLPMPER